MLQKFDAFNHILRFTNLRIFLGGMMGKNNWFRKGTPEEDEVVSQAAKELIEGVVDANLVNKVKQAMGVDLRDQVTIEEIEDWARDRDLRGMKGRN